MSERLTEEQVAEALEIASDPERGYRWQADADLLCRAYVQVSADLSAAKEAQRTLAHQLDRRSQGRDAETQGLMAQLSALQEKARDAVKTVAGFHCHHCDNEEQLVSCERCHRNESALSALRALLPEAGR